MYAHDDTICALKLASSKVIIFIFGVLEFFYRIF